MPREIIRLVLLAFLIYIVISDILELLSYFPSTSLVIGPLLQRMLAVKLNSNHKLNEQDRPIKNSHLDGSLEEKLNLAHGSTTRKSSDSKFIRKSTTFVDQEPRKPKVQIVGSLAKTEIRELNEEEKKQLESLKIHWMEVMQKHCLPKLVCELHASVTGQNSLTELEIGLLSIIKEANLGTSGEIVSKYHFAAHMGQLLSGVEGNGCHNFYPNCPISGSRVLQMLKEVKVR